MKQDKPGKAAHTPQRGRGGELHQQAKDANRLTTNQGVNIADNQNSLRIGERGPTLMEDFIFREKITHFDHERIPERVVHARGSGAHGYFQVYKPLKEWTKAAFLQDPTEKTPVFVRFSTVAGSKGSFDTARDVRGFAVKFYTQEGNFDLVGNNIPVFFIQDAIKFPDLIHSVKPEPDRGFPQAQSAHDTFWDFASLMPESMHMLMWIMSDRAIPRSFRMMQGFGVHTFRFVDAREKSTFVKFHWRPRIGTESLLWDEAVKISGADPDFHRRDLWNAIATGDYPEFELGVQTFDRETADTLDFDVLDASKIIPEEIVPLEMIGKLVLNRNPDNFFAETEQVAFCPSHVVPGIDFTNDPLLQGRLHSYIDTQLSRLGGPNFHQIPVNRPVCPLRNFQRDAAMQMEIPKGRSAYEPSSLDDGGAREAPQHGLHTYPATEKGTKLRIRAESFADHYSQPRLFWLSMTEPEQLHIVNAFGFELGKVETAAVRQRMLGHLQNIHPTLGNRVAHVLGMEGQAETIEPAAVAKDLEPSPMLSIIANAPESLRGRKIGVLLTDDSDAKRLAELRSIAAAEGAQLETVALRIGGVTTDDGNHMPVNHALHGAPSVLFDTVVLAPSENGVRDLLNETAAVNWVRDAFAHLKVIAYIAAARPLFDKANLELSADAGVISLEENDGSERYVAAAKRHRIWERGSSVSPQG